MNNRTFIAINTLVVLGLLIFTMVTFSTKTTVTKEFASVTKRQDKLSDSVHTIAAVTDTYANSFSVIDSTTRAAATRLNATDREIAKLKKEYTALHAMLSTYRKKSKQAPIATNTSIDSLQKEIARLHQQRKDDSSYVDQYNQWLEYQLDSIKKALPRP